MNAALSPWAGSRSWQRRLRKRGCELLDAPVTGTKPHAASGELSFLIGGSEAALATAQPVLSVLGREFIHLGPTGSGALMKLINNFMCGVQAASLAEAEYMIGAGGLDLEKALAILTHGAPGSGLVQRAAARAFANDFTPNFPLHLMAKDLGYAIGEASLLGRSFRPPLRPSPYSKTRSPKATATRIFPR